MYLERAMSATKVLMTCIRRQNRTDTQRLLHSCSHDLNLPSAQHISSDETQRQQTCHAPALHVRAELVYPLCGLIVSAQFNHDQNVIWSVFAEEGKKLEINNENFSLKISVSQSQAVYLNLSITLHCCSVTGACKRASGKAATCGARQSVAAAAVLKN